MNTGTPSTLIGVSTTDPAMSQSRLRRRYTCTLCNRRITVAHFLRHLESHRRQAIIDLPSIQREFKRFQEAEG